MKYINFFRASEHKVKKIITLNLNHFFGFIFYQFKSKIRECSLSLNHLLAVMLNCSHFHVRTVSKKYQTNICKRLLMLIDRLEEQGYILLIY